MVGGGDGRPHRGGQSAGEVTSKEKRARASTFLRLDYGEGDQRSKEASREFQGAVQRATDMSEEAGDNSNRPSPIKYWRMNRDGGSSATVAPGHAVNM